MASLIGQMPQRRIVAAFALNIEPNVTLQPKTAMFCNFMSAASQQSSVAADD
jgi:hypothetical protein